MIIYSHYIRNIYITTKITIYWEFVFRFNRVIPVIFNFKVNEKFKIADLKSYKTVFSQNYIILNFSFVIFLRPFCFLLRICHMTKKRLFIIFWNSERNVVYCVMFCHILVQTIYFLQEKQNSLIFNFSSLERSFVQYTVMT